MLLQHFPDHERASVRNIVNSYLKRNKAYVDWLPETYEIVIDGQVLPETNFIHSMKYLLDQTNRKQTKGTQELAKSLFKIGVPRAWIQDPSVISSSSTLKTDTSQESSPFKAKPASDSTFQKNEGTMPNEKPIVSESVQPEPARKTVLPDSNRDESRDTRETTSVLEEKSDLPTPQRTYVVTGSKYKTKKPPKEQKQVSFQEEAETVSETNWEPLKTSGRVNRKRADEDNSQTEANWEPLRSGRRAKRHGSGVNPRYADFDTSGR
jgi:hypothetical protein